MPASMPASPAGPPTPPVALAGLLALEELDLRLIAGPADAELLWVHASEMADPYPYLLGGELLLSAGVLLTDPDTYVARLVEAGAAALGFGVRPVHDTVPMRPWSRRASGTGFHWWRWGPGRRSPRSHGRCGG